MKIINIIFFVLAALISTAQKLSLTNNNKIIDADSSSEFSFIISGHFHGSSSNLSGFPAASVLANIDMLNNEKYSFIVSTGDMFMDVAKNIPQYKKSLFNKINCPIFNAVGNHDISSNIYSNHFGNTWFAFAFKKTGFIFLDTEINDGSISGKQFDFLKSSLNDFLSSCKQIFIVSHRPIWSEADKDLNHIFKENTRSDFSNNFAAEILPMLKKYYTTVPIYWCSGSLGGNAPASFFYHKKEKGLTYIQSAIRDLPRDGILIATINNEKVSFQTSSLTAQKIPSLEECNLKMWIENNGDSSFNWRLLPLYIKQMLFHRYFWYGLTAGILSFIVLKNLFIRRTKSV